MQASAHDHPDLFWAVRGGGGNFGVAASLEYRLHPVGPVITGGLVAHPIERAKDVLQFFRDITARLPDETMLVAGLVPAPDGSGAKLAAMAPMWPPVQVRARRPGGALIDRWWWRVSCV